MSDDAKETAKKKNNFHSVGLFISAGESGGRKVSVSIDGVEVKNLTSYEISGYGSDLPQVTISFLAEING